MLFNNVLNTKLVNITQAIRSISSSTSAVTRMHRSLYARSYPTIVVQSDGSTFNIRYHEPRKIIKLPLDISTLSEANRKVRLENRKPKQKIKVEEELEDTFSARKYIKYVKKKN
uniref:CSON002935 protein n=1 Tax=Culicoides sonorensis TaxID=179676 RepID=A0A336LVQ4_CULSO